MNVAVSIRVNSPGANGMVLQTNVAAAVVAATVSGAVVTGAVATSTTTVAAAAPPFAALSPAAEALSTLTPPATIELPTGLAELTALAPPAAEPIVLAPEPPSPAAFRPPGLAGALAPPAPTHAHASGIGTKHAARAAVAAGRAQDPVGHRRRPSRDAPPAPLPPLPPATAAAVGGAGGGDGGGTSLLLAVLTAAAAIAAPLAGARIDLEREKRARGPVDDVLERPG